MKDHATQWDNVATAKSPLEAALALYALLQECQQETPRPVARAAYVLDIGAATIQYAYCALGLGLVCEIGVDAMRAVSCLRLRGMAIDRLQRSASWVLGFENGFDAVPKFRTDLVNYADAEGRLVRADMDLGDYESGYEAGAFIRLLSWT